MSSKVLFLAALICSGCGVKSDPIAPGNERYPQYHQKFLATPTPAATKTDN